jgi:AcrR family transcriptional regulator
LSVESPDKPAAKRQQIIDAAVRLADADGLEAVSMRRLAELVGVGTMSIYTYVSDKDELLDLMRDQVAAEMLVPEPLPSDWREALWAIAIRSRDAIEAHPWSFDAEARRPRRRINTMRHIEQSLSVVRMLGVEGRTGATVLMAVDDYVIGHCIRKRARERLVAAIHGGGNGDVARVRSAHEVDAEVAAAIEAGELPLLKQLLKRRGRKGPLGVPPKTEFEDGLEWLLDGIEAMARR